MDRQPAADTLAEAEHALRAGDAKRAEQTYMRALGKLGPFADPIWCSGAASDARTKAQCHARLAAIAFDGQDYERSLRETTLAAAARHEAIEYDRCTNDDIRFMITALVHSATVHDRLGSHQEALESSSVALEFARFARSHEHDPATRRAIAAAQRAATRLHDELASPQSESAESAGAVDSSSAGGDEAPGDDADRPVIDLTDSAIRRDLLATASIDVLGIPDDAIAPDARMTATGGEQESFADLVDVAALPETSGPGPAASPVSSDESDAPPPVVAPESDATQPAIPTEARRPSAFVPLGSLDAEPEAPDIDPPGTPDLLEEVTLAARRSAERAAAPLEPEVPEPAISAPGAPDPATVASDLTSEADEAPVDHRFVRPRVRAEREATRSDRDEPRPEVDIDLTRPLVAPVERRQDPASAGESAAQLIGRSRGQALLARVLMGQSDSEAAINAHRAVRTATRARQWAKEDPNAMPVVALNLIEALVIRGDVLVNSGHDEVARTDLRRARAIAEQLWQACPSPTSATALAAVALRSAVLDHGDAGEEVGSRHLEQARTMIAQARALEVPLPDEVARTAATLDRLGPTGQVDDGCRDELVELGDHLLDRLQTMDQDPAALAPPVPVS